MKAVLALTAVAGLAGCVAYDPYLYNLPYPGPVYRVDGAPPAEGGGAPKNQSQGSNKNPPKYADTPKT